MTTHSEAVILVRSVELPGMAPHAIGLTPEGAWVRLGPLSFRHAGDANQFKRWDKVRYQVASTADDFATLVPRSLEITGELLQDERQEFLAALTTQSLAGTGNLVLLKPQNLKFVAARKTPQELAEEKATSPEAKPFNYRFRYQYESAEGAQDSAYLDPDMDTTFRNLAKSFGEPMTVARVMQTYGKDAAQKGVLFVMSRQRGAWAVCGLVGLDEVQPLRSNLDLVV